MLHNAFMVSCLHLFLLVRDKIMFFSSAFDFFEKLIDNTEKISNFASGIYRSCSKYIVDFH